MSAGAARRQRDESDHCEREARETREATHTGRNPCRARPATATSGSLVETEPAALTPVSAIHGERVQREQRAGDCERGPVPPHREAQGSTRREDDRAADAEQDEARARGSERREREIDRLGVGLLVEHRLHDVGGVRRPARRRRTRTRREPDGSPPTPPATRRCTSRSGGRPGSRPRSSRTSGSRGFRLETFHVLVEHAHGIRERRDPLVEPEHHRLRWGVEHRIVSGDRADEARVRERRRRYGQRRDARRRDGDPAGTPCSRSGDAGLLPRSSKQAARPEGRPAAGQTTRAEGGPRGPNRRPVATPVGDQRSSRSQRDRRRSTTTRGEVRSRATARVARSRSRASAYATSANGTWSARPSRTSSRPAATSGRHRRALAARSAPAR